MIKKELTSFWSLFKLMVEILDREDILKKIRRIKQDKTAKFPNIYLVHGDFTDSEMNELYHHPKVKTHITLTHGEGFYD